MDDHTTLGLVMMAVVVCVVITSMVWVIIIYHWRRKGRRPASLGLLHQNPSLGPYPPSPQPFHAMPATDPLMGHTADSLAADDAVHTAADIVLEGPDTSSEHSTGKDSGVGGSSQRSTEDLRQVVSSGENNSAAAAVAALQDGGGGPHSTTGSSLMLYPDSSHLPALYRGKLLASYSL